MDKYGVQVEHPTPTKEASEKRLPEGKVGECPACGEYIAQPAFCRRCGTLPWEKKP